MNKAACMANRPDKEDRKAKLHQWRAQQRADARLKLPLSDEQMKALFDMLDSSLNERGCDHTLRLVRAWAEQQGVRFDALAVRALAASHTDITTVIR